MTSIYYRQRREHAVFGILLQTVPGLEDRLMEGTDDDVQSIAEMVRYKCNWSILLFTK